MRSSPVARLRLRSRLFAASPLASQHTAGRSLRRSFLPAPLHRLAQSLDDLGRQPDPPRPVRRGLDAIQTTGFAPFSDGGHRHVQSPSRCLGTTAAIATLPLLTRRRSFRTTVGNPTDVAYPLNLLGREHSSQAGLISFRVQLLGDLAIRVILGQNAEAIDDRGGSATGITGTRRPGNLHRGADLRLPTQGQASRERPRPNHTYDNCDFSPEVDTKNVNLTEM